MEYVFYSVNEDGEPYDRHETLTPAVVMLRQFPNDTVVITVVGSPTDEKYAAALKAAA